jgi:rubredoxin
MIDSVNGCEICGWNLGSLDLDPEAADEIDQLMLESLSQPKARWTCRQCGTVHRKFLQKQKLRPRLDHCVSSTILV